jgi:RecB family endonuclease NucS
MPEPLRILAGDCTVIYEDVDETRRERGNVLVITKPDNTEKLLAGLLRGSNVGPAVCRYPARGLSGEAC